MGDFGPTKNDFWTTYFLCLYLSTSALGWVKLVVVVCEQENSKDPADISKQVQGIRAPTKKTKSKPPLLGTAQLNDKNKSDLTPAAVVANQNQQMALLQRQSAGMV